MLYGIDDYTVESVLEGHPDKVCDQICDSILDAYLDSDTDAKVAVECMGTGNTLFIGGEVFSNSNINVENIAARTYEDIGYTDKLEIFNRINIQSKQLRDPVLMGAAGDQGIIYGFACGGEYNYLPYGVYIINAIAEKIDLLRKNTNLYLPDGKVQITFMSGEVETLIVNIQHYENSNLDRLREIILNEVSKILPAKSINKILFNNKSDFVNGGFSNDTGLSGRKIINDTYCGLVPHGGGAFSGKDPSKVDRSAAYMARFVAKNIVANELAEHCLVSVAYAFGEEEPVMLNARTENAKRNKKIEEVIKNSFDFRPNAIIERLILKKVNYRNTSKYGHFSNKKYPWEKIISI